MRAITMRGVGASKVLELNNVAKPIIIDPCHDVLIRVVAAGVNRADISQRRGHFDAPTGSSPLLGLEVAGVVESVGSHVSRWRPQDKVMALVPGGGYAEFAIAHDTHVMPISTGYSFTEAAAIPESFLSAWHALHIIGNVQRGHKVLIHAGAGSLGTAASQLVEKYFRATAITTCSTAKLPICRQFASMNIDRTTDEYGFHFERKIQKLIGDDAIDVIIDPVLGNGYFHEDASVLAQRGKIIVLGYMGGPHIEVFGLSLFRQNARVIFSTMRGRSNEYKAHVVRSFSAEVLPLLRERLISPLVGATFDFENAAQAHTHLQENNGWGNTVLLVDRTAATMVASERSTVKFFI